ncbi:MAG: sodium:proton antiporter, partial [Verrucomicrobiota bacterium]
MDVKPTEPKRPAWQSPGLWVILIGLALSLWVGKSVEPTWRVQKASIELEQDAASEAVSVDDSSLWPLVDAPQASIPMITPELVYEEVTDAEGTVTRAYYKLTPVKHWHAWSLLPAIIAVLLCFLTREPVTALSGGILCGALLMQQYDITGQVLIPELGTTRAATILVLYLWFLGGLMGMWSRNGAALAFAELMTRRFVRGPVSARLVAWFLGVLFFQGGTMSTVLVGTTVRPVADKEKISHEELSYIVDSTASPIAVLLPFNAWPLYVQSLIFLTGVSFLATEADRVAFFYEAIPLYFYAFFAVLFTFLLCFDKLPFLSPAFKRAIARSRETGQLDRPGSKPLISRELEGSDTPEG